MHMVEGTRAEPPASEASESFDRWIAERGYPRGDEGVGGLAIQLAREEAFLAGWNRSESAALVEAFDWVEQLEAEARRFYHADGSFEVLDSADDVVRRRIEAAGRLAGVDLDS